MEDGKQGQWDRAQSLLVAGKALREGLAAARANDLPAFLLGVRDAFTAFGIVVDRINLPASIAFGFRHPTLAFINLTWTEGVGPHCRMHPHRPPGDQVPPTAVLVGGSPYYPLLVDGQPRFLVHLQENTHGMKMLQELAQEGFEAYAALALPLPSGAIQPLSVSTRGSFPDDVVARFRHLEPLLACAVDALYQGLAALHVAAAYIGPITGQRVLQGEFVRGNTRAIRAGILFCDVRGFTALSQQLGAARVVEVMNQVFEVVGAAVEAGGGEILKFIGDAVLSIFPAPPGSDTREVVTRMITVVRSVLEGVEKLAQSIELPVAVGFGGHLGEVLYGNIGTSDRLDFTVMGPAVNLASRLEGLCKTFQTSAVFSDEIAPNCSELCELGLAEVRGVAEPVRVWGFPRETAD